MVCTLPVVLEVLRVRGLSPNTLVVLVAVALLYSCSMNDNKCVIVNWNVRGLSGAARRQVVRDLVNDHHATVVCLQETKL